MFSSLRSRLWLTYVLVVSVVLVVVSTTLLAYLVGRNWVARVQLLSNAAQLLRVQEISLREPEEIESALQRLDETLGMRVLLIDSDGNAVGDSRANEEVAFPTLRSLPQNPLREAYLIRDDSGKQWLYSGRQILGNHYLVIATPRQPLIEVLASPISGELFRAMFLAGLIALLLSLLLAYLVSRWVAAPLQRMSQAARAVAAGDRSTIEIEGPREVRSLGSAFNEMLGQVDASQRSQRDFVANVSHELKTPLTSIQGFAQAILDGTADSPEAQRQAAQVIYDQAGHMHRLVADLLDLARLDAGTADLERAPLDLIALLGEVANNFQPLFQDAKVKLELDVNGLPQFIGDRDRLALVFTNLLDNALKHTPAGGVVKLHAAAAEGVVTVSVADSGSGIPTEELPRIFERFYQVDKSRQGGERRGAGLGLAIAQEIIHSHGGEISVHSQPGQGSLFEVRLPYSPSAHA